MSEGHTERLPHSLGQETRKEPQDFGLQRALTSWVCCSSGMDRLREVKQVPSRYTACPRQQDEVIWTVQKPERLQPTLGRTPCLARAG